MEATVDRWDYSAFQISHLRNQSNRRNVNHCL